MKKTKIPDINLLPGTRRRKTKLAWAALIILLVALVAGIGRIFYINQQQAISTLIRENSYMTEQISSLGVDQESLQTSINRQNAMEEIDPFLKELETRRISFVQILGDIYRAAPPGMNLEKIELRASKANIYGQCPTHSAVVDLLDKLKSTPQFAGLTLLKSDLNKNIQGIGFSMEIVLKDSSL